MSKLRFSTLLGLGVALAAACGTSDKAAPGAAAGAAGTSGAAGVAGGAGASAGMSPVDSGQPDAPLGDCSGLADLAGCGSFGAMNYCYQGTCLPATACNGRPDGSICDPSSGFVSSSGAFCAHEQCHPVTDFVVECWNLVPTCTSGQSYGVYDYALMLASEATCPADGSSCITKPLSSQRLPDALIDCGRLTPSSCAANQLSSGAISTPGTHEGKVRCQSFTLEETYCMDAG